MADSQRGRLLAAVATVVSRKGYSAATVADVIARAGVSRRTFYEFFPNFEDCYLAAYDHGMRQLLAAIREAVTRLPKEDWRARTRAALAAYLETLAAMPDAAWAYTIEVMGAGRRALQARAWVTGQWTGQWRTLHALGLTSESAPRELDEAQLVALVGGIEELVRDCLQRRGAAQLPSLLEPASCFALAVLAAQSPGSSGA
ncbi:MAG TPA: TetR/AcrR family transcriptional regulator [Pseudomonadota bacterium]|nr:TetR/AcrR family transcriptional regulator [Pseudomonadota bacterium]